MSIARAKSEPLLGLYRTRLRSESRLYKLKNKYVDIEFIIESIDAHQLVLKCSKKGKLYFSRKQPLLTNTGQRINIGQLNYQLKLCDMCLVINIGDVTEVSYDGLYGIDFDKLVQVLPILIKMLVEEKYMIVIKDHIIYINCPAIAQHLKVFAILLNLFFIYTSVVKNQ